MNNHNYINSIIIAYLKKLYINKIIFNHTHIYFLIRYLHHYHWMTCHLPQDPYLHKFWEPLQSSNHSGIAIVNPLPRTLNIAV